MAWGKEKLLQAGALAPEFQLEQMDGGPVRLSELLAHGPVLLAFFKISCPVCQIAFPFLQRLQDAGSVPVYGISQNDAADTHDFNQAFGVRFPVLLDAEAEGFPVSDAYGISNVPTLFLVDGDGKIANVIDGWQKREMAALAARNGFSLFRADERVPEWKPG